MVKNETYQVTAICENCGHTPKQKAPNGTIVAPLEYKIPIETSVKMFFRDKDCPICGCRVLRRFP